MGENHFYNSKDENAVVEIVFDNPILNMNMKLLIVDDDLPFRERLTRSMEKKGFDVTSHLELRFSR